MEEKEEFATDQFSIIVNDQSVEMEMSLPAAPVKARRMLPVIQTMSDSFVKVGEDNVTSQGKTISCKKGCGACCRQLVPVSEMEAHHIADLVENLPEPRQAEVKKKFDDAVMHFKKNGWLDRLNSLPSMNHEERLDLSTDFFQEDVSCPLLEDGACSIHKDRPLICREYLVTTPAENCSDPVNNAIETVSYLTTFSTPLLELGKNPELESNPPFLPLMLSLIWAQRFPENSEEKSGKDWMTEFFGNVERYEKAKNDSRKS